MWVDPLGLNADCAFGNKSKPREPRAGKDIEVDANGMVKSQANELLPQGASTTLNPNNSPLSGHYHTIPEGSQLPEGLGIKLDGKDVIPGSPHAPGHATIFPTQDMSMDKFKELFNSIPWQYGGKK
ncbi:Tse2 family ADP-ribosyltransferase toxin [Thorsellia kenyensis]|uniref:Tse2 family ADP-ribosyltransferase toxin n=1 Tax=Thorsellia kenyensis TaxID=1549888 RepID=UPI00406C5C4F